MFTKKSIKNSGAGSYTVEAAIFLPIFILGILTIGYIVKIIGTCETVHHAAADEVSYLASKAYIQKAAPGFVSGLTDRIEKESRGVSKLKVSRFRYLYSSKDMDKLISFNVDYRAHIKLPLDFRDGVDVHGQILTRGFVGSQSKWPNMPFAEMETNGDSELVWIFPEAGKKYHAKSCTYVTAHPVQRILNDDIKNHYAPCHICDARDLPKGSIVYCFIKYGGSYHRGNCKTIEKYVVEIEKREAIEKGYTPCSKCGGG